MGIIRLGVGLLKWGIAAYLMLSVALLAWTFLWPDPELADIKPADAIICLGDGMLADGTLAAPVLTRLERCVQLYQAGLAPVIVFSGGTAAPNGPSAGGQMALYAIGLGLPDAAAMSEPRAQSMLQNALFSLDLIPDANRLIVVTEAFHLPRSWASFKWAAWELGLRDTSISLVKSENVRRDPVTGAVNWNILFRESLAIWFNGARALAFSVSPNDPIDWLH